MSSGRPSDDLDSEASVTFVQRELAEIRHTDKSPQRRDYTQLEVDDDNLDSVEDASEMLLLGEHGPSVLSRLPSEGGSVFEGFLNMANSVIGAGIIGLPFSFKETGFGMGIILLVVLTVVVDWTVRLLIYNSKLSGRSTYQTLMEFAFGRPGLVAISIFQFAFAFGGMCAYGVIIGDTIPHVIRSLFPNIETLPIVWIFANRRLCIAIFVLFVSYPLSLYRDISKLAKTSGIALVAIVVIIVSVIIEGPKVPLEYRGDPSYRFVFANNEIIQGISVISFAFVSHHNSFLIFGSLREPSMNKFAAVTHWSMALSFVTSTILAIAGYTVFTNRTAGNILNNFPPDAVLINVARLAFGINMFTTIPLEAFVCREVLEMLFWPSSTTVNYGRHFITTTLLVLAALVVAMTTSNLGIVLELTGAFSATALAYILPPLCYIKLASGHIWQMDKLRHWVCIIFGLVIMVVSTFSSLKKAILPSSASDVYTAS